MAETELARLLERTNELLAVLVRSALAPVLEVELKNNKNAMLYKLTGGDLPVTALARKVGVSTGSVSNTWQRWERLGLLVQDGKRYRKVLG